MNVLKVIDTFYKEAKGARAHYDRLSEMCHPNSLGHHMMFGSLDKRQATVSFSTSTCFERGIFDHVIGGFSIIALVSSALDRLDRELAAVAHLTSAG